MNQIENFKKFRAFVNLSQAKLATALGVKSSLINNIECGNQKITPELAFKIEDTYNISARWLLLGDGEMPSGKNPKTTQLEQYLSGARCSAISERHGYILDHMMVFVECFKNRLIPEDIYLKFMSLPKGSSEASELFKEMVVKNLSKGL